MNKTNRDNLETKSSRKKVFLSENCGILCFTQAAKIKTYEENMRTDNLKLVSNSMITFYLIGVLL